MYLGSLISEPHGMAGQAWSFHRPNVSQHGPLPRPNQARLFIPSLRLPRFRDRRQGRDGRGRQDHARTAHLSENVCVRFEEKHLAKS